MLAEFAAADFHLFLHVIDFIRAADLLLDVFSRAFTNQQRMDFHHVVFDRIVHRVTAAFHTFGFHDVRQRNDGDFGRTAADIDDHATRRFRHRQFHADGARQRLFDKTHFARARLFRAVLHSARFNFIDTVRHGDDDTRLHDFVMAAALVDEIAQHLVRDFRVCDDAVLHRTNRQNVARITAKHLFGLRSDGDDFARIFVQSDDGRLLKHNAAPSDMHQRVHRP